jgi:micrococcal nuclease
MASSRLNGPFERRRLHPRRPAARAVVWLLTVAIAIAAVVSLLQAWHASPRPADPRQLAEGVYRVERVVDGDTLVLANGVRVRLIGADTPETVKPNSPVEFCGPEATRFTRDLVAGREVSVKFDGDRIDRYGRLLAVVWIGDRMLNEELIRAGLARARTQYNYSQATKARFLKAQAEARAARRGIWSAGAAPAAGDGARLEPPSGAHGAEAGQLVTPPPCC